MSIPNPDVLKVAQSLCSLTTVVHHVGWHLQDKPYIMVGHGTWVGPSCGWKIVKADDSIVRKKEPSRVCVILMEDTQEKDEVEKLPWAIIWALVGNGSNVMMVFSFGFNLFHFKTSRGLNVYISWPFCYTSLFSPNSGFVYEGVFLWSMRNLKTFYVAGSLPCM